ncbi:putative signal transducing protein [Fusibacter tunisiensis]|uniref:DUF2007 domain-containing protein n=1 Tax=Fusibacter tunisiensis TaxID=1008308 RepID=A0ABS2MN19_9FIRM|nr:DUF2007 domain-containing protein [Fusibacter tunisiensis]MBM7560798.1 hypothetical protein [Fusibacter tunisiensis]
MKKLVTLDSLIELEMFKEVLDDQEIPVVVKHQESGDFMTQYTGTTIYGIDLFVEESDYEKASNLYNAFFSGAYPKTDA